MYCVTVFTFVSFILAAQVGICGDPNTASPPQATMEASSATSSATGPAILRNPKLFRLIWLYHDLTEDERRQLRAELRKPLVREKVRKVLDSPDRWEGIRRERPQLYRKFEESRRLARQYWKLLQEYHQSTDKSERADLKKQIRAQLIQLVDAETKRYEGELARLKQHINLLEKRLEDRRTHRKQLIQERLVQDLTTLPPPPRFGPGPRERGRGRGPRGRQTGEGNRGGEPHFGRRGSRTESPQR